MTSPPDIDITMVVAATSNNVIAIEGEMPFKMRSDMRHFRETTMGNPVVMGRKTWETLKKPLEGRRNIVMSRRGIDSIEGAVVARDTSEVLDMCDDGEELMVIGGGEIYREWLPYADRILLSRIDTTATGDITTFPALDPVEWHCVRSERRQQEDGDDFSWTLLELVRHYEGL